MHHSTTGGIRPATNIVDLITTKKRDRATITRIPRGDTSITPTSAFKFANDSPSATYSRISMNSADLHYSLGQHAEITHVNAMIMTQNEHQNKNLSAPMHLTMQHEEFDALMHRVYQNLEEVKEFLDVRDVILRIPQSVMNSQYMITLILDDLGEFTYEIDNIRLGATCKMFENVITPNITSEGFPRRAIIQLHTISKNVNAMIAVLNYVNYHTKIDMTNTDIVDIVLKLQCTPLIPRIFAIAN